MLTSSHAEDCSDESWKKNKSLHLGIVLNRQSGVKKASLKWVRFQPQSDTASVMAKKATNMNVTWFLSRRMQVKNMSKFPMVPTMARMRQKTPRTLRVSNIFSVYLLLKAQNKSDTSFIPILCVISRKSDNRLFASIEIVAFYPIQLFTLIKSRGFFDANLSH